MINIMLDMQALLWYIALYLLNQNLKPFRISVTIDTYFSAGLIQEAKKISVELAR